MATYEQMMKKAMSHPSLQNMSPSQRAEATQAASQRARETEMRLAQAQANTPSLSSIVQKVASAAQSAVSAVQKTAKKAAQPAATPAATSAPASTPTTQVTYNTPVPEIRTTMPTYDEFAKSGFYTSANLAALQEQLANYNMTDAMAREQAEAEYRPAYDLQRVEYENQLAQLGTERDRDIKKLNSQYDRSLNALLAGLNARNMGRSSLVATRGVESENARNAAIADTSYEYLLRQNEVNSNLQKAGAAYAQSVESRASDLMRENTAQRIQLMGQIAQLQQSGYSAYASYLSQLDSLALDQARLDNERIQNQLYQNKLDNERLQFENEKYKLETDRLSYKNDAAKLANEKLALQAEKAKAELDKLTYKNEKAKAKNDKLSLANDKTKLANDKYKTELAAKKAGVKI